MHQFASMVLSFLLTPFHWIILLILAAYFFRSTSIKRYCRIGAVVIFLIFSNQWLLDNYARSWQPPPAVIAPGVVYSCGIVPGGFASPDLEGNGFFNVSADRFLQALLLYKTGHIKYILVNGGNGKEELASFREAGWAKQQFIKSGVPDSAILVEDRSNNTAENAANAKKILDANQLAPPYLLVSSAHHIPRATVLFKNAGIPTIAFPCSYMAGRGLNTFASLVPRLEVLTTWPAYLKETAGYLWYK